MGKMEWVWYKEDGHERIAEGLSEERRERIEGQREREAEVFLLLFRRSIQEGGNRKGTYVSHRRRSNLMEQGRKFRFFFLGNFFSSPRILPGSPLLLFGWSALV
jgi:hypothetical protein